MALSSSSGAVTCENALQSRSVSAEATMPSSTTSRVSVSRLGTRAFPPRSPKDTHPSLHGQISRVRPMLAPRRAPRCPVFANSASPTMLATNTTSCIETSTRSGAPEASAASTAYAVSPPTCAYPDGSLHRTGGRSGSPVAYMFPLAAITPRSDARHPERGPVRPNGVTLAQTACGAVSGSRSKAPGNPGVSMTASAVARRSARRASPGPSTSTLAFPALHARKRWGSARSGWPPRGSTNTTSAPRSPRIRPAIAAGSPARSTTRVPARSASVIVPLVDLTLVSDYCDRDRPEPSPAREEPRHDQVPHRRRRLPHPRAARHLAELAPREVPGEGAEARQGRRGWRRVAHRRRRRP